MFHSLVRRIEFHHQLYSFFLNTSSELPSQNDKPIQLKLLNVLKEDHHSYVRN